jgi:hypothetical protein
VAGALLVGGLVAAPVAAWLVRHLRPRLLGASVGGLMVVTNLRTLLRAFDVAVDIRAIVYTVAVLAWVAAVAVSYSRDRNDQREQQVTSN